MKKDDEFLDALEALAMQETQRKFEEVVDIATEAGKFNVPLLRAICRYLKEKAVAGHLSEQDEAVCLEHLEIKEKILTEIENFQTALVGLLHR